MFCVNVKIKPSAIHGNGVFAADSVKSGTIVYQDNANLDLIISEEKFAVLAVEDQQFILHYGAHSSQDNQWHLAHDHIRFCNHSNTPNLKLSYPDAKSHSCQIVAILDIKAEEEFLQDYREFRAIASILNDRTK